MKIWIKLRVMGIGIMTPYIKLAYDAFGKDVEKRFKVITRLSDVQGREFDLLLFLEGWEKSPKLILAYSYLRTRQPKLFEPKCGITFDRNDFHDHSGCLKQTGHNDEHVCQTPDGSLYAWEDNYDCKCGCWEEYEKEGGDVCKLYRKL